MEKYLFVLPGMKIETDIIMYLSGHKIITFNLPCHRMRDYEIVLDLLQLVRN